MAKPTTKARKRYLDVPFQDKDKVKELGARWDPKARKWYIPSALEPDAFRAWYIDPNVTCSYFYLLSVLTRCWNCKSPTTVFAIGVPEGHEYCDSGDGDEDIWQTATWKAITPFVEKIPRSVFMALKEKAPDFKFATSKQAGHKYLMNHCGICGIKIGDFNMHNEPGGEFHPISDTGLKNIEVSRIDLRFEAKAGYCVNGAGSFVDEADQ